MPDAQATAFSPFRFAIAGWRSHAGRSMSRLLGLRGSKSAVVGVAILTPVVLFFLLGPSLLPNPVELDTANALKGPSGAHLFGTDEYGRDMLARIASGGRQTMLLAIV